MTSIAGWAASHGGEGGGVAFGQQVQDPVGLGVDHDRSVDVAAPESEVVHADGAGLRRCRVGQVHHTPQQRGAAGRDAHGPGEAGTGPARPARAGPISPIARCSLSVTRPWRRVSPGSCSANVRRPQAEAVQKNRRTRNASCARRPAAGRSAGNRR